MAKAVKKKGKIRRLKRSIRKTLGALFLASALAVAAIPTEGLQASNGIMTLAAPVQENVFEQGKIPKVDPSATIYTYPMEGTGVTFRFAYVARSTGKEESEDRVAVILGYEQIGNLEGGTLTIPDTMEAYKKYSLTSTDTGSVAVNMNKEFLYYRRIENVTDSNGNIEYEIAGSDEPHNQYGQKVDANNQPIPVTVERYYPCYYQTRSTWVNDSTFYVADGPTVSGNLPANYKVSTAERIGAAKVAYIGSQYLSLINDEWVIEAANDWNAVASADRGIFHGQTNITNLIVGKDVMGIGDYAFANCGLRSITFGNGLGCLGNFAFANCGNLATVNFDLSCSVPVIGSHCFNNCVSLRNLDLPGNVQKIGDSAFEGCMNLETINMIHEGQTLQDGYMGSLQTVGQDAFKNCSAMTSIEFPYTYGEKLDVSVFQGCSNLSHIRTDGNTSFELVAENGFTFAQFKETVLKAFYLEGPKTAKLHEVATAQRIAYKFHDNDLNMDVYELVLGDAPKGIKYWVNEEGRIVLCEMETPGQKMEEVTLPEVVGPKNIVGIDSGTFQNKCFLTTITIPASVTYIAEDAFKGSHELKYVIFTEAENVKTIGRGAFNTQESVGHLSGCQYEGGATPPKESNLNFVGTISSTCWPFNYAMTPSEYINASSQYRTYITYYSGWPTNLVVRYNEVTDSNELIDYPTFSELATKYTKANGYAYMTPELETAVSDAVKAYESNSMTDYQKELINAALNIVLPEGIESIAWVGADGKPVKDVSSVSGGDAEGSVQGLFSYKEKADIPLRNGAKTLTTEGLLEIYPSAFSGCTTLSGVTLNGPLKTIGNYAFDGCENLTAASISESTSEMGLRPFTGCTKLSNVDFNGSQNFSCDNSIIYELDGSGNKAKLVEYLYGRNSGSVMAEELTGLTEIYPEAFMDTGVRTVDLSESKITNVPINTFRETPQLFSVTLPNTCRSISQDSFTDSSIYQLTIPRSVSVISNDAFRDVKGGIYEGMTDTTSGHMIFYCADDSVAAIFADEYKPPIDHMAVREPIYHKVVFWDWDGTILETLDQVEEGTEAKPSVIPSREGYIFTGWLPPVDCVTEDMQATAQYQIIDPETLKVTVKFIDWNDSVLKEVRLTRGESAEPPRDPYREGYIFIGWRGVFENVQKDEEVFAQYEKLDSTSSQHLVRFLDWDETVLSIQRVDDGADAIIPKDPVREGYTFEKWLPTPTNVTRDLDVYATYISGSSNPNDPNNPNNPNNPNGSGTGSGNGSGGANSTFYTLTVQNGSGSGSYVAGSQPIIIANDPSSTQEFSHWTIDPENTTIASKTLSATVITMPEGNVTVTAHYRAKTGSGSGSGNTSSANAGRPNNGPLSNGGTTVVIDKNGISNTGVVAATVNGSSDNFVIKITENAAATEAVVKALMAEYGSLDNIKYFPMDISLYDSTGTNKITDTTGLSVDITLPIPDSLITYAGNNKVAGVVNDRLDKLSAKFTTISGVSCITFRAEHFSPYVIYVDTANLSAGGSNDSTPKTGDGIHPKWFLSIGLACLSFVMFMQKDRRKPQKAKVKAKA